MPSIKTLVPDIYALFEEGKSFSKENAKIFAEKLAERISNKLEAERGPPSLRMSNLGNPDRKLWYRINKPELGEPLPPEARIKFLFGDILEELLLWLAKEAGHTVTDEQKEVQLHGVVGHMDGRIDGSLVDCKSSSTYGMAKFRDHKLDDDDPFGYREQINSYGKAENAEEGTFVAIDKTLGHIVTDTYPIQDKDYEAEINRKRHVLASPTPPPRCYTDEAEGQSGNRKLGLECSYCEFKKTCWPGLRTFIYSGGKPTYLTVVKKRPQAHIREV